MAGTDLDPEIAGLCADCVNSRKLISSKGSLFLLCRLSLRDPHFEKYPRLPVKSCRGYERVAGAEQPKEEK